MARRNKSGKSGTPSVSTPKTPDAPTPDNGDKSTPPARDNTVRVRTATPDERKPGASIVVGKATEVAPPADAPKDTPDVPAPDVPADNGTPAVEDTPDAPSGPLSGDEALAAITGTTPDTTPPQAGEDTPGTPDTPSDTPAPTGTKAERYAAAAAEREKNAPKKSGAKKGGGIKAKKYPAWMPAAVARSRHISGMKDGAENADKTLAYPGPKQHIAIRRVVTDLLAKGTVLKDGALIVPDDGTPRDVTPENVMSLTGIKTMKALMEIATWEADKSALAPMRPLSNLTGVGSGVNGKSDGWAIGRYLASALIAWVEEMKAEAKATAKADADAAKDADADAEKAAA